MDGQIPTGNSQEAPAQDNDYYEIRVRGHLNSHWSEWFEGMAITNLAEDEALLAGLVPDQAALHGLLAKIRDLGLVLLAVNRRALQ